MPRSLFQAHLLECSLIPPLLRGFPENRLGLEKLLTSPQLRNFPIFPPLEPPPNHPEFVSGADRVLHAAGAISEGTDMILMQKFLIEYKSAAVITPMRSWYTALAIYFGKAVCFLRTAGYSLFFLSALSICFSGLLYSPYSPQ